MEPNHQQMRDGGAFRPEPTGERVTGRRGRPLAGRIAGIVAVVLIATFGTSIAVAYPFVHGSALELSQTALSAQADAVAHFLERSDPTVTSDQSIPQQVLEILKEADVTAVVVTEGAPIIDPMSPVDRALPGRSFSDFRTLSSGTVVFYEFRELRNGNSLFLMQPTDVAERATRTIIGRMILGALFAIVGALSADFEFLGDVAAFEHQRGDLTLAPRAGLHAPRQGIGDTDPHAVQAARKAVSAALTFVEFATGVQSGEDQFDDGCFFFRMQTKGDTPTIVFNADRGIGVQGDAYFFSKTSQCFVGRVIQHFLDDVQRVVGTGVHARPLLDRLKPFEDFDGPFGIAVGLCCHGPILTG